MALSDLSYDLKFSKTQITYSYSTNSAIWDGNALYYGTIQNPQSVTYFTAVKQSISGQVNFDRAIALWDNYSVFNITKTTGLGDINIFKSNTLAPTDPNYSNGEDVAGGIVGFLPQGMARLPHLMGI